MAQILVTGQAGCFNWIVLPPILAKPEKHFGTAMSREAAQFAAERYAGTQQKGGIPR